MSHARLARYFQENPNVKIEACSGSIPNRSVEHYAAMGEPWAIGIVDDEVEDSSRRTIRTKVIGWDHKNCDTIDWVHHCSIGGCDATPIYCPDEESRWLLNDRVLVVHEIEDLNEDTARIHFTLEGDHPMIWDSSQWVGAVREGNLRPEQK